MPMKQAAEDDDLSGALRMLTDELLGVKAPKVERIHDDSEARRTWKRFQMVATLPERDQNLEIQKVRKRRSHET